MLYAAPKNPSVDFLGIGDLQGKSPRCKAAIHGSIIIGKKETFPARAQKNPSVDFSGDRRLARQISALQSRHPRPVIIGKEEKKLFSLGNKREYLKKIICKNRGS